MNLNLKTNKKYLKHTFLFLILFFVFAGYLSVLAKDLTGTNFIVRDPVMGTGGQYGTSTNFKLYSAGNTEFSGVGTGSTFIGHYGFLYYPYVTVGTLSATPSGADANLSWGASTAGGGWSVSGYKTGKSSISGGPYTYTSVGNVVSYSYTGLLPGYYCFVVQTLDALGNVIGTSNESCLTINPVITFSISANSVSFGDLTSAGPRYANTSTGSGTDTVAHTISASSNATSGYIITYRGPTLTSGANTVTPATSISGDGTLGTEQFAISLATSGSATIPAGYLQSGPTRSFVANTTTQIASTSGVTSSETFSLHYLANIASVTDAGTYTSSITYLATGTF